MSVGGRQVRPSTRLALQLAEAGWHSLIISRGFGGTAQRQALTPDSTSTGDEPR